MVGKLIDNMAVCHAPERVDLSVATASVWRVAQVTRRHIATV